MREVSWAFHVLRCEKTFQIVVDVDGVRLLVTGLTTATVANGMDRSLKRILVTVRSSILQDLSFAWPCNVTSSCQRCCDVYNNLNVTSRWDGDGVGVEKETEHVIILPRVKDQEALNMCDITMFFSLSDSCWSLRTSRSKDWNTANDRRTRRVG